MILVASAPTLSKREIQVLQLIADDKSQKEIAVILCIRPKTVSCYLARARVKLGVCSPAAAVARAIALGYVGIQPA